ncbi:hypothetical protein V2J09_017860 [Rumex salicifolius]
MVGIASNSSATILIGMSLDEDKSKELLSWAISILSHPNDTVIALHVLEGEEPKKVALRRTRDHNRYQRSKTFVISVMAEFAKICQSRQVYLQARVRYSSSIEKGLIKEAKEASAEFVVLGGSITSSKGMQYGVAKYCFKHAPKGCSIMSIGRCGWSKNDPRSDLSLYEGSPVSEQSGNRMNKCCPRRTAVMDGGGGQQGVSPSPTTDDGVDDDDDSSCFGRSSLSESLSPPSVLKKHNRMPMKRIVSSLLRLPFEVNQTKKTHTGHISNSQNDHSRRQSPLRCFSYEEISRATNDFHLDNMVGMGGYSQVYRGVGGDYSSVVDGIEIGWAIAVKRLARDNTDPRKETDFLIELGIIGHVSHPNTASLIGYCVENGLYLITDFGLAKWLPSNGLNHTVTTVIEGTFGYLAPEYFMHGMVDEKTDVYAFGVLLLEIITGRMPATPLIETGKIGDLVDPRLQGAFEVDQVHRLVLAASHCVQQSSSHRPSVLEILEVSYDPEHRGRTWRMPKISTEEVSDYSMVFGYNFPIDLNLDEEEDS